MKNPLRHWMAILGCAFALAGPALGGDGPAAVRKQVEASILVSGSVNIDADGRVSGYAIDDAAKLPPGVDQALADNVPKWRFEPVLVDGKPANVRTRMQVRVVARQREDGNYALGVRNASFGETPPGEAPGKVTMRPPEYPVPVLLANVGGTAYVLVRVGRDGSVQEAVVEQVNLRSVGSEKVMTQMRDLLARAARVAARKWRFSPPTSGADVDAPYWSVRVPIDYRPNTDTRSPHAWEAYVPGPVTTPAWALPDARWSGPDALASGGVYLANGTGPRLLTTLGD